MKGRDATLWKCRDGRYVEIGQMETRHIKNAIAKIKRSPGGQWRRQYLDRLVLELEARATEESRDRLYGTSFHSLVIDDIPEVNRSQPSERRRSFIESLIDAYVGEDSA